MMKIEKLKENSIDEILSFASENKNLVIGNNNTFSNDFKNLLTRFAASRNKVNSELLQKYVDVQHEHLFKASR